MDLRLGWALAFVFGFLTIATLLLFYVTGDYFILFAAFGSAVFAVLFAFENRLKGHSGAFKSQATIGHQEIAWRKRTTAIFGTGGFLLAIASIILVLFTSLPTIAMELFVVSVAGILTVLWMVFACNHKHASTSRTQTP